jgi:hypothetical protein
MSAEQTEAVAAELAAKRRAAGTAPHVPLDQVEWRVDSKPTDSTAKFSRCRYVPYVNARIVQRLLDEWVGPFGWSDEYQPDTLAGQSGLWCYLTINGVTKRDFGVPSNMEAAKGLVSDAFKRAACLKWGVAWNVYDLPTLWGPCKVSVKNNGEAVAWFDDDKTSADLVRQLKALGFEAAAVNGSSIEAPSNVDPATGEVASEPERADLGDVQQITEVLNGITDDEVRKATKLEFAAQFGAPADLTVDRVEAAYAWINAAVPA